MTKAEIRQAVWELLRRCRAIRFPGPQVRVPNFIHAERAARLLSELAVWRRSLTVNVCVDAPQLFVRRLAIQEGEVLYLALPGLRAEKCFVEIKPRQLGRRARP